MLSPNQVAITSKSSLQWSNTTQYYLNNCSCHGKIVCTVLFSSRLQGCRYKLFSVLRALRKWQFWRNTKSIIRRFSLIWVNFNIMRYWYDVQLILCVMMWLILLYHVRLQSYSFVEITKIQSSPQLCFQQFLLSKFACVVVLGAKYKCLKKSVEAHLTVLVLEALNLVQTYACL